MEIEQGKKAEVTPLDTPDIRFLLDAIKEMNISRRNVGLYPRNHPQTKESAARALRFLQKLFETRGDVTLGIAKDEVMIEDAVLDKKSTVLREFALSLHSRGITSITLEAGLTNEDLFTFNELTTARDSIVGIALVEFAEKRGLGHIRLSPLDLSKIRFVQGILRKDDAGDTFWNDYIASLMDDTLTGEDMDAIISSVTPKEMAEFINRNMMENSSDEAIDAVVTSYMGKKISEERRPVLFGKFLGLVEYLASELRQRFLRRALAFPFLDMNDVSKLLRDIAFDDMQKVMSICEEQSALLPERVKNLIHRLMSSTADVFSQVHGGAIVYADDIEVDESAALQFRKDQGRKPLDEAYRQELKTMMEGQLAQKSGMIAQIEAACAGEAVDRSASQIVFELLGRESNSPEEYRQLLTNMGSLVNDFAETGRFSEIAEIYNRISAQSLSGPFREDASQMLKGFFGSGTFLSRLLDAFSLWGRHNRDGVLALAVLLKTQIIPPLLDAVADEVDAASVKFFLDLLCRIGEDVVPEAAKRLDDKRLPVVINMIYLIRECGGTSYVKRMRQFMKHPDEKVAVEALKTLLHFKTPDSISYIRFYLQGKDQEMREQATRLAAAYRVKEAVPIMIGILEEKDMFGTKSTYKLSLIQALGEIGDAGAIRAFQKIYLSHAFLSRAELEKLKIEIFKSLHNYDFADIKPLLELGMKSDIRDIKMISEKLLRTRGGRVD
ncbi:MAG: hypothetical protein HZA15_09585 [Nitrospirae bacterium]|nr:hypothetical protein [Nitrospirota bacterium]